MRAGSTEEAFLQFRNAPNPEFFRTFFHCEHRDVPGRVIPLLLNNTQKFLDDYIERCVAMELRRLVDAARGGAGHPEIYIENLLERVDRGEAIQPHEIGLKLLVGKSRRGGVSTYVQHLGFRRCCMMPSYDVLVMAHDQPTARMVNDMVRLSYDEWPARYTDLRIPASNAGEEKFQLRNRSSFAVRTAGQTRAGNEKTRGWKFDFYHFSEYAHYVVYADVTQAVGVARPHAWIIKESTANGRDGPFYAEWEGARYIWEVEAAYDAQDWDFFEAWSGQYKFFFSWLDDPGLTTVVYDWEKKKLTASLDDYERSLQRRFPKTCSLNRLKWRRSKIKDLQHHERLEPVQLFMQEFPVDEHEMFQETGKSIFDHDALAILEMNAKQKVPVLMAKLEPNKPPRQAWLGGANFVMFKAPERGHQYVIGGDVSHGVGRDDSVGLVLDRLDGTTYEEVACFRSNRIDPQDFGHILTMIGEMYFDAFINCEAMGPGLSTNKAIVVDNRYNQVYRRKTLDMVILKNNHDASFRYGFWTSQQGKWAIVGDTQPFIRNRTVALSSVWGVDQLKAYAEGTNGRLGKEGVLDDYVMALCLAIYAALRAAPSQSALRKKEERLEAELTDLDPDSVGWWKTVAKTIATAVTQNRRMGVLGRGRNYFPSTDQVKPRK